jgi:GT2 family glycosyltransferase
MTAVAPPPSISVVVPTYNRAARLERLLRVMAEQQVAGGFEVIVVDDASPDETPEVLERLRAALPMELRVVRQPQNRGPATARNTGWRAANGSAVAFTDDDCMPEPGWLAALVRALHDADIAQGKTVIDPSGAGAVGPFGHTIEVLAETGFYETCNIAYRRQVLESLGGFDETFRMAYGEDTDLGWRGRSAGASTAFAPDAVVRHEVRPSDFVAHLRDLRRREGIVAAIKRHPDIRNSYYANLFVSPAHPWALAWLGAAAAMLGQPRSATRWLMMGAASAGYARAAMGFRQWPPRRRQWATVLPLALIADTAEIAILARASLRYRTLVL